MDPRQYQYNLSPNLGGAFPKVPFPGLMSPPTAPGAPFLMSSLLSSTQPAFPHPFPYQPSMQSTPFNTSAYPNSSQFDAYLNFGGNPMGCLRPILPYPEQAPTPAALSMSHFEQPISRPVAIGEAEPSADAVESPASSGHQVAVESPPKPSTSSFVAPLNFQPMTFPDLSGLKLGDNLQLHSPPFSSMAAASSASTSSCPPPPLFNHSVDALEEALNTLSKDYILDADLGEIGDLNEHLLRDAFFGPTNASGASDSGDLTKMASESAPLAPTGGSLLHSILEYDPSTLARTSGVVETDLSLESGEETRRALPVGSPPSSTARHSTDSLATPKLREKLKMRREKELAELDKAFDWHLSKVAEKNERSAAAATLAQISLPPLAPNFVPQDPLALSPPAAAPDSPIRFSPVHFSPSVSPDPSDQPGGSTKPDPFALSPHEDDDIKIFIPFRGKNSGNTKASKVPIYKQAAASEALATPFKATESSEKPATDTAHPDSPYSFTDEEEEQAKQEVSIITDQLHERKLEEEVARKLLHISSLHPELKVGRSLFSSPSGTPSRVGCRGQRLPSGDGKDLWRHVVPKKRASNKTESEFGGRGPATPLLPPSNSVYDSEFKPTSLILQAQLAEILRKRQEMREQNSFVTTRVIADKDTAKPEAPKVEEAAVNVLVKLESIKEEPPSVEEPRLPKVIIRIPKRNIIEEKQEKEASEQKHRKHKKKKKKRTEEEEEARRKKKKKKKKQKRKSDEEQGEDGTKRKKRHGSDSSGSGVSDVEDPSWEPKSRTDVFSKKRRLMEWASGRDGDGDREGQRRDADNRISACEAEEAAATDQRLAQIRQPSGVVQKGSFLVCKDDIGKDDCPLWKVDNQNLLQKFIPIHKLGEIIYKSSSTYSGWAAQNSDQYMTVQVRHLKHTRSESLVEPEIPLLDLFPAVSTEVSDCVAGPELLCGGALSPPECDQHRVAAPAPDQHLRDALDTYLHALILHCLSGSFLQTIKQTKEWKFLRHMNEIDSVNLEKKSKLLTRTEWTGEFRTLVEAYPLCTQGDAEDGDFPCQACGKRGVEKVVQLFANEGYDSETLESRPPRTSASGSPQPSQEYLVCSLCAAAALTYHKLYHMRYHLFKHCEDKIDLLRDDAQSMTMEPACVLEQCLRNRVWVNQTVQQYLELWQSVK